MNNRKQRHVRGSIGGAVALSVGIHLLLAVLLTSGVFQDEKKWEEAEAEEPTLEEVEEFEVTAVFEEDLESEIEPEPEEEVVAEVEPEPEPEPKPEEEIVVEVEPEPEPEPEEEVVAELEEEQAEEEEAFEEPPPVDLNKLAVVQETNEEIPEDAAHISDQANKVEEETVAQETSMEEVETPAEENANPMEDAMQPTELAEKDDIAAEETVLETAMPAPAMMVPTPEPLPQPELLKAEVKQEAQEALEEILELEEGLGEQDPREAQQAREARAEVKEEVSQPVAEPEKKFDPKSLFQTDINDYEKVFGGVDDSLREREKVDPNKRRLLKDWKNKEEAMRASLENFVQHVKPGNHTGVNASPAVYASYLARVHRRIHDRYVNDFIYNATHHMPSSHPLNRMDLNTLLEIVIDAETGVVEETNVVRSSGEMLFDAETMLVARAIGRHPNPPEEIVSRDGRVYLHWNFWRDSRQCGTFGAAFYLLND